MRAYEESAPVIRTAVTLLLVAASAVVAAGAAPADPKRGEYLVRAAGCLGCHTEDRKEAVPFAGGRVLKTPFGTFFGPNITPHPQAGIGRWSEADFVRAMRHGRRPDGANYFPAFPYPSFTRVTDTDLSDMWAYLRTLPASSRTNQPHDLKFPFGIRLGVTVWKWLYFRPGPFTPMAGANAAVNRGAYLTLALGHCGECHTPRNFLGGPVRERMLAGGKGLDGKNVPNLTPAGLGLWSDAELKESLTTGITREGDTVSEEMDEVVRNTTSRLSAEDLGAMIAYLRSLAPIADKPR
jgi:mono/diheme cytochrome c family protein